MYDVVSSSLDVEHQLPLVKNELKATIITIHFMYLIVIDFMLPVKLIVDSSEFLIRTEDLLENSVVAS